MFQVLRIKLALEKVEKLQQNVIIVYGSRIGRNTKSIIKKTKATEAAAAAATTTPTTATSPFRIPRCHGLPPGDGGPLPRLHRVEHLRQLGVLLPDLTNFDIITISRKLLIISSCNSKLNMFWYHMGNI